MRIALVSDIFFPGLIHDLRNIGNASNQEDIGIKALFL